MRKQMIEHFHSHEAVTDYRMRAPMNIHQLILPALAFVAFVVLYFILPTTYKLLAFGLLLVSIALLIQPVGTWLMVRSLQRARDGLRERITGLVNWRGDEQVLDVGCGSGFLTFACAKKLTSGKAIGIDIWNPHAGGGSEHTFWKNAHAEGVQRQVQLQNVDAREMPFENASFDVIVSSFAMHHVGGEMDRSKAAAEMIRVLKPGGKIILGDAATILDICEETMRKAGLVNINRSGKRPNLLIAEKPGAAS